MYALRERLRYGIVHFAISALICAAIIFMVYKRWYTQGMAELLGVSIIVIILATTSLFVWPLLTALVVKQDKQEQRRDHRILWSIQIVFTIITLYFLAHSRIVWAVYTVDSFEIIRAQDVLYSDKVKPKPEFMVGILDEFKWLGASFSTTDKELEEKQRTEDLEGLSVARRIDALVSIEEKKDLLKKYAKPIDSLRGFNNETRIQTFREQFPQATLWLPIKGFTRDAVVLTNADFSFFNIVMLVPWEED